MPSFSMTHSCLPKTLYKPQWTNMPNLASCHHFIRRMRSASSACGCCACGCCRLTAFAEVAASVTREAPVPTSQSRRVIPFRSMSLVSSLCVGSCNTLSRARANRKDGPPVGHLHLQFENPLHLQPLLTCSCLRQRLLKLPHQFFPFTHS